MKTADVRDKVNSFFIKKLEEGEIPRKKSWDSLQYSGQTGKVYNGINQMLLSLFKYENEYDANTWYTYNQLSKQGGYVKKGSKGAPIVFWKQRKKMVKGEEETIPVLKYNTVFNRDQTSLKLRDEPYKEEISSKADEVYENMKMRPGLRLGSDPAYSPKEDSLIMPLKSDFKTDQDYYSVLFHELGHSTGLEGRLGRFKATDKVDFGSEIYSKEELVAESCSAYLCSICDLEGTQNNSAAYIQGWLKKIKEDPKVLMKASGEGWKAAMYILNKSEDRDLK